MTGRFRLARSSSSTVRSWEPDEIGVSVVYGAMDMKAGAMGSLYNVACDPRLNHQIDLTVGVLADECGSILTEYFDELRADKAERNEVDQ